jgi:hypothetical protein
MLLLVFNISFYMMFVLSVVCQSWPCQWTNNGFKYDLRTVNTNVSDDKYGQYQSNGGGNTDFWKLCDPTTNTPLGSTVCASGTQVCQQTGDTIPV